MKITNNHPIREAVENFPRYHKDKAGAFAKLKKLCKSFGVEVEGNVPNLSDGCCLLDLRGSGGRWVVCECCGEEREYYSDFLSVSYYTLRNGLVEITARIT
jgi:hypothetical protein